jgi:hypothetical protein
MTEPRDRHRERDTEAATADGEPEVRHEVIQDLDMPEVEDITGGGNRSPSNSCRPSAITRIRRLRSGRADAARMSVGPKMGRRHPQLGELSRCGPTRAATD